MVFRALLRVGAIITCSIMFAMLVLPVIVGLSSMFPNLPPGLSEEEVRETIQPEIAPKPAPIPQEPKKHTPKVTKKQRVITLQRANTLVLRGVVDGQSVSKLILEATVMSWKLKPTDTIYLVLDTPGGSVVAGQTLIDALKALPQKFHTITLFSASMGFHIVQNMDNRLITQSGTLMSHRASLGGLEGQAPGEVVTMLNYWLHRLENMDRIVADRMDMSVKDYQQKIYNEYWIDGSDSVQENAADEVIMLRCGRSMLKTYTQNVNMLFFTAKVTWSTCPVIQGPVKVTINMPDPEKDLSEAKEALNTLLHDRKSFYTKYIKTGLYPKYFETKDR